MDRITAEQLMRTLMVMNEQLNLATSHVGKINGKDEQESLRRAIGSVIQTIYIDLMRPVIKQYPDLDPDRKS
jgi:hypothetical protein